MDSVSEIPTKRRKLDTRDASSSQAYDSQNESGDDLFEEYETVATVPLPHRTNLQDTMAKPLSSPPQVTQPTQPLPPSSGSSGRKRSIVQVAASSPMSVTEAVIRSPSISKRPVTGRLANTMAPAGTAFRLPMGVSQAPPAAPIVDLSDDDLPVYRGDSSDEGSQQGHRADIKPSLFTQAAQKPFGAPPRKDIKEILSNAFYKPVEISEKPNHLGVKGPMFSQSGPKDQQSTSQQPHKSADIMANAYGGASRIAKKVPQRGPAKAKPISEICIEDIEDYHVRTKIQRMRSILPQYSVRACRDALHRKKYSYEDAIESLLCSDNNTAEIDLTVSDDELTQSRTVIQKPTAKQHVKAPNLKIQEKWTATQTLPKDLSPSSPIASALSPIRTAKPKRRLIQGRRQHSPPPVIPQRPSPASAKRASSPESLLSGDVDSGVVTEFEDVELDGKVLNFFNTCSVPDLADIAAITEEIATFLLSQKPFTSLSDVRRISGDGSAVAKTTKRKTSRKLIGDKIVDKCLDMWTGYAAVDELVKNCEALGQPVCAEMKKWGVNVFGGSNDGELEVVTFDRNVSPRDSGVGTPTSANVSDEDYDGEESKCRKHGLFPQPLAMAKSVQLKDYQVVGLNWLLLLFEKKLSCILADDMGLGKTCQVIAFLAHLLERGIKGPHLVVVPGSTLENWLREFSVFCPRLHVMPYYASLKDRPGVQTQIRNNLETLNVIITTYTLAKTKDDNKFLRSLKPVVCVYDEGHLLKNSKSAGYEALMRIPAQFRLLLTGTPLQNNLRELASLLGFILPSVFKAHSEDLEAVFSHKAKTTGNDSHAALLSNQRIARAKSMMTPFILRRKKYQVLKHLPAKTRRIEYCELTQSQSELYEKEKAQALRVIASRAAGEKTGNETSNILMALRKASIHPLLFRRLYHDKLISKMSNACLKENEFIQSNVDFVFEDMSVMTDMELHLFCERYSRTMTPYLLHNEEWMDSGKVNKLCALLETFKKDGDRVLVFSQFVMVMDILEAVMETLGMRFFRLDGNTKIEERQDMIDQFYREADITAFLLSTKAGGAGINLACANKVIIFDSSFNPQDDIQAENRAHRVGQTREVEVVRLVTRDTIEEQIHALGETKLALDDRVAGFAIEEERDETKADKLAEKQGAKLVEEMMIGKMKEEIKDDVQT